MNRLHPTFLAGFVSLFAFVLIIPSLIVYFAGGGLESANGILGDSKQTGTALAPKAQVSPITIGWTSGDKLSSQQIGDYKNLTVVSPEAATIDNRFNLQVNSTTSITNTLSSSGKVVWARVDMNRDTKTNVHNFLTNHTKTHQIIKKLRQTAQINHWYGINLDIESVSSTDRTAFSQFIKNLSLELNNTSIILSIDLPSDPNERTNDGAPFDHNIIGKYCDYIVFMGYDEHWSTDPVPGPVTSLLWLKKNLQEFIQTGIPSEKIILGLPAYTRIWQQNQQGKIVKNPAEPIQYVESLVAQNRRDLTWDSELGEYYTTYQVNNLKYKIWLPTSKSLNIYLGLIPQFHLAGSAVWDLNLMNSSYWNQIYN